MVRTLIKVAMFLASCAIGLAIAVLVLENMTIRVGSFVLVVVIFGALQAIVSPLMTKLVRSNAEALLGGVGLFSTFLALLITHLITPGLSIRGVGTWILACVIIWIITMIATMVLPRLLLKKELREPPSKKTA